MIAPDHRKREKLTGIYEVFLIVDHETGELRGISETVDSALVRRRPYDDDIMQLKGKAQICYRAK